MRVPISIKIIILILFVIFSQAAMLYWISSEESRSQIIENKKQTIQREMVSLQDTLQFLAENQRFAQIQKTVTSLGVDPELEKTFLLDENQKIIASTRIELIGKDVSAVLNSAQNEKLKENIDSIRRNLKNIIWDDNHGKALYIASPIILGRSSNEILRSDKIGTMYMQHDMSQVEREVMQNLLASFGPILLMLIITGLGLGLYFHLTISSRLEKINGATNAFGLDGVNEPIVIKGNDEISDLAQAFNHMTNYVFAQHSEILKREEDLSVTLNSIGDAVIATDKNGKITRMNYVAEELTGWSLDDALGQHLANVFVVIDANTRKSIDNPVDKVIQSGKVVYLKNSTTLISKDGKEYHIADSAAPIRNTKNEIQGMVLVFNDVTEQYLLRQEAAKSKQDLQDIFDHYPAAIYVKDTQGRYTFINREFELVVNVKRENITGKTDDEFLPKEIADVLRKNDIEVISSGEHMELDDMFTLGNEIHYCRSIKFPLFDLSGVVYATCGILTDVTERKQKDEMLFRSQKMNALGKLTGGVAHDYNNLLGIISGYAELLLDNLNKDSDLKKHAEQIYNAADRGTKLTKKLMSFSRHNIPNTVIANVNDILTEQKLMLEKTLTPRIQLTLSLTENPWLVEIDSDGFENAILNLSINAMHAMDTGGKLLISTSNIALEENEAQLVKLSQGDYLLVTISDTGCGMDENTKNKIFDPFFTTKGQRGTGLGLSQVYGFVEQNNGSIQVYSELNYGTRFAIYIPKSYRAEAEKSQDPKSNNIAAHSGSEAVLVVDDEIALVNLARDILTTKGYHVLTANDGVEAMTIIETEKVDILVTDVIMPNMDGFELANHVQQSYPHIKILLVSGFSDERNNYFSDESLHQNMLSKPYTGSGLVESIRSILDND